MNSRPTRKRIVSKRDYAILVGKREALRWGSVGMAVVVAAFILTTVVFIMVGLEAATAFGKILCFMIVVLLLAAAWSIKQAAEKAMQKALTKLDAVPLSRANAADLPAPDTLVRASEEPIEEQQTVLLRAAVAEQQTPQEQLVRAVE